MYDFLDYDFSDFFSRWNRPFREKDGYYAIRQKDGKGFILVFNTLGIKKEDIKVIHTLENDGSLVKISVSGKTDIPEINNYYEAKYSLSVSSKAYGERIEDVKYSVKDGLTVVYIKTNVAPKIESKNQTKYIENMDW